MSRTNGCDGDSFDHGQFMRRFKIAAAIAVLLASIPAALFSTFVLPKIAGIADDLLPGGLGSLPNAVWFAVGQPGTMTAIALLVPFGIAFALIQTRRPGFLRGLLVVGVLTGTLLSLMVTVSILVVLVNVTLGM